MKKNVIKIEREKIITASSEDLLALLQTQGADFRYLDGSTVESIKAELARRGQVAQQRLGAVEVAIDSDVPAGIRDDKLVAAMEA